MPRDLLSLMFLMPRVLDSASIFLSSLQTLLETTGVSVRGEDDRWRKVRAYYPCFKLKECWLTLTGKGYNIGNDPSSFPYLDLAGSLHRCAKAGGLMLQSFFLRVALLLNPHDSRCIILRLRIWWILSLIIFSMILNHSQHSPNQSDLYKIKQRPLKTRLWADLFSGWPAFYTPPDSLLRTISASPDIPRPPVELAN